MATDVAVTIHASSGDYYAKTHSWVSGSSSGPAYDQVVLDEVITANRIGTGNNGKYYSDWRFYTNGSEAGSFSIDAAEGYELQSVTFTYTVSNSGALYMGETKLTSKTAVEVSGQKAIFQCKNTNTSTNGQVRLTAIAVTYQAAVAPLTTVKTVYCKAAQSWWKDGNAAVGIYAFKGETKNAEWPGVRMTAVEGETDLWKADIDTALYSTVIFTRMNPVDGENQDWGAKTADLTVPADKNLYTITSTSPVWGDPGVTGEWSVYSDDPTPGPEPPTPVDSMTVYFVNYLDWANVNAFVWPAEGNAYKEWPGEAAKKEAEKINEKDVYAYTFPASYVNVIFNNGTVQTTDQKWAAAKPYFVPGAANEQGKIEGAWYAKEDIPVPPTPATPVYNIAAVWTSWKLVELEVSQDKKTATYMVELPKGNYEFKIVRTLDTDTAWLTKENEGAYGLHRGWPGVAGVTSTANNNLAVQADENGVYLFTWTFENDSIGIEFPKVYPLNEIWGVDSETAVAAGTTYADNYAINIKSVFAGTLKENARTFGGVAFTHAIQVRNNAYPSADHPEGTEQSGSTSLIVTAKENVEIELYYNRQTTSSETGAAALNDGKDIIVFDQAAPTTKMDGKFKVLWMQDDKKYVNAIKVLTLEKGHVYTISAKGTTAQLHGIRYVSDAEAPIVIPAKYYLTGDSALLADAVGDATLAWKANAIKSETDTFTLSLKANQEYKLKLIENGDWEGGKVYGYEALTEKAEGLSKDNDDNILFKLNAAGDVKVVYFWEEVATDDWKMIFKLIGNFYVEPTPVDAKFYVTGDSALVTDAGFAGKAWNPAAIKAEADTLVLNLKAEQVYKLKVTLDGTWNTAKGFNDLSETPAGLTMDNDENIIFSLAEAGAVKVIYIAGETPIFKLEGNFYVDPTPVVPTAAVTGDMTEWGEPIPFELSEDSTFATLYNDNIKKGTYDFKMIINGNWRSNGYEFHRGFPGCAGITGNTDANMTVVIDVEGAYTFKWYFANDSLAIIYPEKPEPAFKDGFYLVGKFGGVDAWNIDKNKIFTSNPSAEGEYMLENVTLAAGDSLKIVWVENDEIKTWYPEGANYGVDTNHAGVKTIYFRADGQGGADWFAGCIYIAPNEPTAITNVNADAKAVKSLKNGILMIEKDGKVYNVIGLQIR